MIRHVALGVFAMTLAASASHAGQPDQRQSDQRQSGGGQPWTQAEARVHACITTAAEAYRLPAALILILLKVEGGDLGAVSGNTNDTVDIGPMQVNTIWVPQIARHWRTTPQAAYVALRDNFCANIEGGTWILRQALDEAGGDFWSGVGIYHSHNPVHRETYLRKVLAWTLRLRDQARRTAVPDSPPPSANSQIASRN
jgi:hypothetical protein